MVSVCYVHTGTGRNVTNWSIGQIVLMGPVVTVILCEQENQIPGQYTFNWQYYNIL